jgi:hypothetical protein
MATKDDADFRLAQLRQTPTDEIQLSDGDLRALTFAFFHEADQQAIEALSGPADAPAGGIALSAAEIVSERQADLAMLAGAGDDRSDEVIDVAGLANVAEAVLAAEGIAVDPPLPAPPPGVIQHRAQAPERLTYSHV